MGLIHSTTQATAQSRWPGFDWNFYSQASALARSPEISAELAGLGERHAVSGVKPLPFAPPVRINASAASRLARFCRAYHRLIGTIVSHYPTDRRLQETITLPPAIARDAMRDQSKVHNTISLCRIDFYLHGDGEFSVLETNANCPGGLLYGGIGTAFWRNRLPCAAIPLASEDPGWFGSWYLRAAETLTGKRPERLAILGQEGGYRAELDEIAAAFQVHGVATSEFDPRCITKDAPPNYGYLKLSIPEFTQMRHQLDGFVDAVLAGDLFVQNGLRGRWIGDNKLCLAVLSDPAFADLFNPADIGAVRPHIPWSRNAALLDPATITQIRNQPADYVLKRPLDTRGRGVVIGLEIASESEWMAALATAIAEGWLVMRHVEPTYIASDPTSDAVVRHDLALGLIDGKIASGFLRSSPEHRMNVALSGRLHPVFIAGNRPTRNHRDSSRMPTPKPVGASPTAAHLV